MEKPVQIDQIIDNRIRNQLLDLMSRCLSVETVEEFKKMVKSMQGLFEHGHSFCSYVNLKELVFSKNPRVEIIDVSYPTGLLAQYFEGAYNIEDPVSKALLETKSIQNWNVVFKKCNINYPGWGLDLGVRDGYSHVTFEPHFSTAATFSFNQVEQRHLKRTETIIQWLTPHLSLAFKKILGVETLEKIRLSTLVTPRELEVLKWLKQGKSSWEVSRILNISERTVNFHTNNIVKKLGASNRLHAVAIALNYGIINL